MKSPFRSVASLLDTKVMLIVGRIENFLVQIFPQYIGVS